MSLPRQKRLTMNMNYSTKKIPRAMRYQPDPSNSTCFQVVDDRGAIWAHGIPHETAARVFAASPGLLLGYDSLLEDALESFRLLRWDIGDSGPDLEEFVEDEGELEEIYPGAPAHACWLQDLLERARAVRASEWESPIELYVEPQAELF